MTDLTSLSDAQLMGMLKSPQSAAQMSDDELLAAIKNAPPSVATDTAKSALIGIPKGVINAAGQAADTNEINKSIGGWIGNKLGISPETQAKIGAAHDYAAKIGLMGPLASLGTITPGAQQIQGAVEQATGPFYKPQTMPGRFAQGISETVANPLSYVGPGGVALKAGGAALSGAGSEAGAEAAKRTGNENYETLARVLGGVVGGGVAAKTLGPKQATAAVPTRAELNAAADADYTAARNSGVEFDPKGIAQWAAQQEQNLTNGPKYAFTKGDYGTAPKTLDLLDTLQNPPAGGTSTASNLDTLRRAVNNIAGEVKEGRPTPDAKAAMVLKRELAGLFENPPQNMVVAGNAADFAAPLSRANANAAAGFRVGDIERRINSAEVNTEGSIAANLANQIKSQIRPILKNPKMQRGFTSEELDAIGGVNKGSRTENILNQLGRGGAGVVPIGLQFAAGIPAALATGGATVIPQAALAAALYGARKGGERLTASRADALVEMLAKRSPEYERRVQAIPQVDNAPNKAALLRAMLAAH